MSSVEKKRVRDYSATNSEASVDLVFPQDASTYSDFGSIMLQVERMMLPEDESRLKEMGFSQAVDWDLSHQFQAANLKAMKTAHEASSRAVKATIELNKMKSDVDLLGAKLKAKESDYDSLYDQVEDNMLNAIIKTRTDVMREYNEGCATE
ncbi:hypothetical protein ACOSQ4_021111 [Xanthoceras sorbifolium]